MGRALLVATALLLLISAGAAGTRVFVSDGGSVGSEPRPPSALERSPGDRRLAQARSADPVEGLPWGVRLYTSAAGQSCVVLGRLAKGHLGIVQGGRFSDLPSDAPGVCNDLERLHVLATIRSYGNVTGGRTVLYGVVDRTIRSLTMVTSTAEARLIPIAADGTFITVLIGVNRLRHARLRVQGLRGSSERLLGR
jgi:hypothetical protein